MSAPALDDVSRWRLVLGDAAEAACRSCGGGLSGDAASMDVAMEWLYGRAEGGETDRGVRRAGRGASRLTSPQWISEIHRLFPKETVETVERDAIESYGIDDVVTDLDVLSRAEPNETLLKAVMQTKHLMAPEVLAMARELVREVVRKLMESLARDLALAFSGVLDRRRHSPRRSARDLDFRRVVRDNLRHYDPATRRISVERLRFFARNQRHAKQWQVVLLVDQSGSMVSSVIHSAVTAACLWGLPGMRTHLVAFDTNVVDLTRDVDDPVELLMKVQLGGGTDIQGAVGYAAGLLEQPDRSIVVLISDLYEGSSKAALVQRVASLVGQRTLVLVLAALDMNAEPDFDREMGGRLVEVGAEVGAMTPGELAGWLAGRMRG